MAFISTLDALEGMLGYVFTCSNPETVAAGTPVLASMI